MASRRPSFAAKEAVIKAHPALKPSFHRIVIARQDAPGVAVPSDGRDEREPPRAGSGPPVAVVRGPDDAPGSGQQALVSISHDGAYATAVCVGFEAGPTTQ